MASKKNNQPTAKPAEIKPNSAPQTQPPAGEKPPEVTAPTPPAEGTTETSPHPTEGTPPTPLANEGATPPATEQQPPEAPPASDAPSAPSDAPAEVPSTPPMPGPTPPVPPADEPAEPADEYPAHPVKASEPGVGDILRDIDLETPPVGYVQRKPNPRLSPEEADMQAHLFAALVAKGVPLRDQGGVYPWLLRQVREAVEV